MGAGLAAVAAVLAYRHFGIGELLTLDSRHQAQPLSTAVGFFAIYGAAAALSIPGAMILTLAAGAIFGLGLAPERPD
ncbi:COG0398: uncharacterized membrane protein / PF00070 family, FAD-dependent NAD(P)-disulphide oxidoreductase [Polaromonas sp. CG9_12]|nr:COG0398: uncharacterized membrane protein / PF00070 family, FAD-dependent NAD(P)-disulphide oxidoreductase [Polaromonas sp. CG9_12]